MCNGYLISVSDTTPWFILYADISSASFAKRFISTRVPFNERASFLSPSACGAIISLLHVDTVHLVFLTNRTLSERVSVHQSCQGDNGEYIMFTHETDEGEVFIVMASRL